MTTLAEKVTAIGEVIKTTKIEWIAERDQHETTDLLIYVHLFRGDDMVAVLQCPLNRDTALQAAQVATYGMAATEVVLSFEAWHSELPQSPITHEDWQPGEMAYVGQTMPEAIEQRWVTECLTIHGFDRLGGSALASFGYVIDGTKVSFDDSEIYETTSDSEAQSGGYMVEVMTKIMAIPSILEEISGSGGPGAAMLKFLSASMDETDRDFHMDCAALKAMAQKELIVSAVLVAVDNPERQQMIAERFGDPD